MTCGEAERLAIFLESSAELLKRDIDRQHVHHTRRPDTNYASAESHESDVQLMLI